VQILGGLCRHLRHQHESRSEDSKCCSHDPKSGSCCQQPCRTPRTRDAPMSDAATSSAPLIG
jgi:hypothetical protein